MERITTRLAAAAAVVGLAVLAAGCVRTGAAATGTSPASAASRALPSPFTITANYTAKSLGLTQPESMAVGPDGDLYVTDLSQLVTVISPAGKVLRRWGKQGAGPGEFNFISNDPTDKRTVQESITVGSDGKVYVSDSGGARVEVFTPQGNFVREFGSYGNGRGQFLRPFDLVVDSAGDVYVVDDEAETLSKFSPSGKLLWTIGGATSSQDLVGHFHVTSIDSHGRLVVVNDDQNKILYIDQSGHVVDAFSPSTVGSSTGSVCEVSVDRSGNSYVSGCNNPGPTGPMLVYDRTHRLIAEWPGTITSLRRSPVFGPHDEVFALATDGSILRLHITLPGA